MQFWEFYLNGLNIEYFRNKDGYEWWSSDFKVFNSLGLCRVSVGSDMLGIL